MRRFHRLRGACLIPNNDSSSAPFGSTHQLTGRLDGMNEHGLMIGLHQVKKKPRFLGLSADLIVRMILDQCSTTTEAVAKLRQLPHAMQYNYSLLDADGVAAVVEASPGAVCTSLLTTEKYLLTAGNDGIRHHLMG
jgi:predicted choloylglycine hydrolase